MKSTCFDHHPSRKRRNYSTGALTISWESIPSNLAGQYCCRLQIEFGGIFCATAARLKRRYWIVKSACLLTGTANVRERRNALHGLILSSKMDIAEISDGHVIATLNAGNFDNYWLSTTHIQIEARLRSTAIELSVTARNTGDSLLPVGIGWHPYFSLPSGKREQARLHIPARKRALVDNYDDAFPTGQIKPVAGTPYDFTAVDGARLGHHYFDHSFVDLEKTADGYTQAEIFDPEAHYNVRLTALSPEVRALQVYSPPGQPFVVVEPQFNLADPFSPVWSKDVDTGMVILAPGQEVTWAVRVELFTM